MIAVGDELSLTYDTARRTRTSMVKDGRLGQCPSSPPAPPQGAPDSSGQLYIPRGGDRGHWAPHHCLECSSEPPPKVTDSTAFGPPRLTCRNLTRGGDGTGEVATIPRKGVPSNVPLAFALGGTNGIVATLLELEVSPPPAWSAPVSVMSTGAREAAAATAAATVAAAAAAAAAADPSTPAAGSEPTTARAQSPNQPNRLATLGQLATAVHGLHTPPPPGGS